MTPSEKAKQYANDVVAGKIPNCKWVVLACKRFLNDLKRQNIADFPYIYSEEKADRAVRFMELLPHTKGKWASDNQKLILQPWQCFIECNIFGWVRKETGKRRFRMAFELIPRKSGKSIRVAARGIYLFAADGETGAEIYSGATSEKQAFEVYKPAWIMVSKLDGLRTKFGIEQSGNPKNPGTMFVMRDMSKFEVMIGKPGDGASPHGAIIDEYHEHDSDHMVDTMQTGMGAREQPLLSVITTAGSNLGGPCYEMQQDMQRILEGVVVDETVFCIMFGIDDNDPWDSIDSIIKANPNYGISVFPEFLLSQLDQAKRSASKQNAFRTKHLNEWVGAKTAWMNMVAWQKQRRNMKMEDFKGCECRVAVDLASKKDVTAVDITFKQNGHYYSFKKFFAPEAAAEENEKYMEFVSDGSLELTDGSMVDQEVVEDYLDWLRKEYNPTDFAFDEWQADYMMTRLMGKKFEVVKFPFRLKYVSEPMKQLEALVLSGQYWHDGNKMMTWMMSNVAAKMDLRDNIYPNKARPNDPKCKIDGVAAAIMSVGRFIVEEEPKAEYSLFFV